MQVDVTDAAKERLKALAAFYGMSQIEFFSRVLDWCHAQDAPSLQLVFGNLAPEYAEDAGERLKRRSIERLHALASAVPPTTAPGVDHVPGRPTIDALLDVRDGAAAEAGGQGRRRRRKKPARGSS